MSPEDDHYRFEEEFHSKDRKIHRKERKLATSKDRSKYKKSDQDQLKKRQPTALVREDARRGRVLAILPEGIVVDAEGSLFLCNLKGSLKQEKLRIKNLVAVGDFVQFVPNSEKEGTVISVEERYSILSRADNLSRRKEQLIAVNIDQVLITTSVVLPPLKASLVDRYIIAAHKGNMQPLIIVNKIDLLENPPAGVDPASLEEERTLYTEFLQTYKALDIPVYPVSTVTGQGVEALKIAMQGKSSVFSGQSGVGKSSLINAMTGSALRIGALVEKTSKGSHTTTTSHLLPLECGGFCIDTPGIKSFGVWDLTLEEVQSYFSEISAYRGKCKFLDCMHLQEPQCAVKKAVEEGEISPLRFASYCALMDSVSQEHRHR